MLIMKNKLTYVLRSLSAGSVPMRKGTTLLSNKGYFHLQLPNSGPTQGCQNVTGCGLSAPARVLWDLGKLHSSTKRGHFFPSLYSWCGAFSPNAHSRINKLKPTCIQTGWRLQETQKTILNTRCINHSHQVREIQRKECNGARSPNPDLMLLLDPSLIPDPCLAVFQEKEPQMIVAFPFIQHAKLRMMYTDDARIAS